MAMFKKIILFILGIWLLDSRSVWSFQWDFGGSLKGIGSYQSLWKNEERLRLQGSVSHSSLRFEWAHETFFFLSENNPDEMVLPDFNPLSSWNAEWLLFNHGSTQAKHRLDRLFLQWDWGDLRSVVGKQVISMGVGRIFNAVSQMQRYPLIFIDPEFPKTEDAVTLLWNGGFQLESRYLTRSNNQEKDSFHFRAKGEKSGFDLALTAGRSDDKFLFGLESAGNLNEALIRGEIVAYFTSSKEYLQGLLGIDYVFSPTLSSLTEIFYNGFGEDSRSDRLSYLHRSTPFRGTWYLGNHLKAELHPLLKFEVTSIANLRDPCLMLHFLANYSFSENIDFLLGHYLSVGSGTDEFGGQLFLGPGLSIKPSDISYLALRWYF